LQYDFEQNYALFFHVSAAPGEATLEGPAAKKGLGSGTEGANNVFHSAIRGSIFKRFPEIGLLPKKSSMLVGFSLNIPSILGYHHLRKLPFVKPGTIVSSKAAKPLSPLSGASCHCIL